MLADFQIAIMEIQQTRQMTISMMTFFPEDYCGTSTAADPANSGKSTAAASDPSMTSVFATPESVMPPEGDAATISPQRGIAMPSPAWSQRSRRRDLVFLDQDKKSVEVTLGQISSKKSGVPPTHAIPYHCATSSLGRLRS